MATLDTIASLDTPTSGTFIFTGLSLSSYKMIEIVGFGIRVTTDGTDLLLTFYVGGTEITGTAYQWVMFETTSGGTNITDSATGAAAILLCSDNAGNDVGSDASQSGGFSAIVDYPGDTTLYKKVGYKQTASMPNDSCMFTPGAALMSNAGAIDGVKISGSSNLVSGYARILALA